MLILYLSSEKGIRQVTFTPADDIALLNTALWIDLLNPTVEEEKLLEQTLNLNIPTKKEVEEIEISSRLYLENDMLYMTATMVLQSDSPQVKTDVVTFIFNRERLITLRYADFHAFHFFSHKLTQQQGKKTHAGFLLLGLLEAAIDRLADILEKISHKFDGISELIFHSNTQPTPANSINYQEVMQNIGASGDLGTKTRESLISFSRLISFLEQSAQLNLNKELELSLTIIDKDINSLSDYANFLSSKYNFLLDATLGLINIEQNNIIKIFSVAAVIFLPPTLIASIYGMNFKFIPELQSFWGYPISLTLMGLSAWLPYRYFKKKKWL